MNEPLRRLLLPVIGLSFLSAALAAQAAPPAENLRDTVVTDPALADADFEIQGEYLDPARLPGGETRYMGLQVVALGGGRFEGVVYQGGLPGAGWDRVHRATVQGETSGDATLLAGDQYSVVIRDSVARLLDSGGSELGQLAKIHRISPTQGLAPPPGAIVLFDGAPPTALKDASLTPDGLLEVGSTTATPVQDFRLHVEFRTPYMPYALGQRRGNSGVYIQRRYEVQILDSFGLEGKPNECGGLYRQTPPDLNMCLPPLSWQTYDIHFTAARWNDAGEKTHNARITVYHNGVAIHENRELPSKTGAGRPESPQPLPIHFQNHGNPVHFRNMWLVLTSPVETAAAAEPAAKAPAVAGAPVTPMEVSRAAAPCSPTYSYRPCRVRRPCGLLGWRLRCFR